MKIEIYCVDDWEALYIDGKLWRQNHSGLMEVFLKQATYPLKIDSYKIICVDDESDLGLYVPYYGCFPDDPNNFELDDDARDYEPI